MTKAIAQTYTVAHEYAHEYRLQISYALIALSALMVVMYGLNLYGVINRTVAIEHSNKEVASLSSAVQSLDAKYLELSQAVAAPSALASHGLSRGEVAQYISRTAPAGVAFAGTR